MRTIIYSSMLLLVACNSADDRNPPEQGSAAFDGLAETIDEAEAVEQQLQEQKERMDRALQDAERAPESS